MSTEFDFNSEIYDFFRHIDSLMFTFPALAVALDGLGGVQHQRLKNWLSEHADILDKSESASPEEVTDNRSSGTGPASDQPDPVNPSLSIKDVSKASEREGVIASVMALLSIVGGELSDPYTTSLNSELGALPSGYSIPLDKFPQYRKLMKQYDRIGRMSVSIKRSALSSMIAQYDAYVGRLLVGYYDCRPEQLKGSNRQFTFEELSRFGNLQEAAEFLVEKEVETLLRENHITQIKKLEELLDRPLRKGLLIWPQFIELTQRRNLFAHTDGKVSRQYIKVCSDYKVSLEDGVSVGSPLPVTYEYFRDSCACVLQLGIMLGQVMWRVLRPEESEAANSSLNSICVELIQQKQYELAARLLEFGLSAPMKLNNQSRLLFTINLAQTHKWRDDEATCQKKVEETDWSGVGKEFVLAKHVLLNEYSKASEIMEEIGSTGPVRKMNYLEWPLFQRWRRTSDFKKSFKSVFKEESDSLADSEHFLKSDPSDAH